MEDKIRQLCARAIAAGDDDLKDAISELQAALREHTQNLRKTLVKLYQYYPNKHSLLFAVIEKHRNHVMEAVERACVEQRHQPLGTMVDAVVQPFVDAKLERRDASVALCAVASESGGEAVLAKLSQKRPELRCRPCLRLRQGFASPKRISQSLCSSPPWQARHGRSWKLEPRRRWWRTSAPIWFFWASRT
jgi:hypothetical protein